jgi:acetyltransferase-like isoleucine patch superfamily enzyme
MRMRLRYTDAEGNDRSRLLNTMVTAHHFLPGIGAERLSWEFGNALARRMGVQTAKWSTGILLHGDGKLELGPSFNIRRNVEFRINAGEVVRLGDGIGIDSYTILEPHGNGPVPGFIEIGAFTRIAASTHHYGADAGILAQPKTCRGITIGDGVWIASHVAILDGVTIGDHSVIGAGSVVRASIPPRSVAVGAPARVVKTF